MKFAAKFILIGLLAVACAAPAAFAQIDNPITKAVLDVYEKQLQKDPKDYMTWFRRANEYYRHNEYDLALNDVNQALNYAPASDKDLRFQAYLLRGSIYNVTNKKQLALSDLNSAVALDPASYAAIYQRGNTAFELGQIANAQADYNRLLRFNPRSAEALVGLARCAVKEKNFGTATDLLQKAVDFDPNNPIVYVRRASVRRMMGDDNGAIDDLIVAMSLRSSDNQAMAKLVEYGNTNYAATVGGLTRAIQMAPENPLYRYLRASIAEAHFNYVAAIEDFQHIINDNSYNYHGLHAAAARCLFGLARYDEALAEIDAALAMTTNVADYYVLRSRILRALGRSDDAMQAAALGLVVDRANTAALVEMALNQVDKKEYRQADELLGEAVMANPNDPVALLTRSWLLRTHLNQPEAADQYDRQALDIEGFEGNVRSLRGFALLNLGQTEEADRWMIQMLALPDNDGLINYYATCFYNRRGDDDAALRCAENSLKAGYSDLHNWNELTDAPVNMAPLRDDLRFLTLLNQYTRIFGK